MPTVAEVDAARKLLEEERLAREWAAIDAESQAVRNDRIALEQTIINNQRMVDPFDWLPVEYGFRGGGSPAGMAPYVSTLSDTQDGRYVPFILTEQDVSNARALARWVTTLNCPGIGIVENLFGFYVSTSFKSVVPFAAILLMLAIKPSGLLARHYVKKV